MDKNSNQKIKKIGLYLKVLFIPCNNNNYRPKLLEGKYLIYILLLACFLRLSTFLFFWQLPNISLFADISKIVLIDSLNEERSNLNLGTLQENDLLNQAAFLKAIDMMQKGYFSHISPEGITPWYWFKKVGYDYKSAGENLGIGFIDSQELHQAWNDSPLHKANLTSKNYKEVGISFVEGNFNGSTTTIVVQMFGTQKIYPLASPEVAATGDEPVVAKDSASVVVKPATAPLKATTEVSQTTTSLTNFFTTTNSIVAGDTENSLIVDATSGLIFISSSTGAVVGEVKSVVKPQPSANGVLAGALKFFAKDYNSLTQKIVWVFLIINLAVLILNIFIKIFVQHYDLILKAALISLALILLVAIGPKEIIALLQPRASIF